MFMSRSSLKLKPLTPCPFSNGRLFSICAVKLPFFLSLISFAVIKSAGDNSRAMELPLGVEYEVH